MGSLTNDQMLAIAKAKRLRAEAEAQPPQPTGAEAMRARGLATDPAGTAEMNTQAEAGMRSPFQKADDAMQQFGQGGSEAMTTLMGAPSDLASWGLSKATGKEIDLPGGADFFRETMAPNMVQEEPRTEAERRIRTMGEYVAPGMMGGVSGALTSALSGAAAGEVRERDGGPVAEIAAALIAGGVPLAIANKASKVAQTKRAIDAIPDIDALKTQAGSLYETGKATGKTAAAGYTRRLNDEFVAIARNKGMISPTGRMTTAYPKVSEAMRMVEDYAGQKMSPVQMRQVRETLKTAAQSADSSEARIGTMMLKKFDEFVEPLVPEFKVADKVYSRAMRGEEIKESIDIAKHGRRTAGVTAIGGEFQNRVRQGIRGDLTYPPELEAAVERAANGGAGRQLAEGVGKGAPTSIVGGGLGFGVPASVATGILGPVGGAAVGTAASGTGLLARLLANRMARGDARVAMATALNGAALPAAQTPEAVRRALMAQLLATGTAQQ